jgi:murein DD-endopeptidase MepM/ murein hydrolase activator NlpD
MKKTFLFRLIFSLTPILPCFLGFSFVHSAGYAASASTFRISGTIDRLEHRPFAMLMAQALPESACPTPALSRLTRHTVALGETVEGIAQQYNLIPATLLGFNPALRSGQAPAGTELTIPPFNGIRVEVPAGTSWRDLADRYGVRADALFEVNGCQETPSSVAFVPGVNWSPSPTPPNTTTATNPLSGSPLSSIAEVLTSYGWQIDPSTEQYVFQSGVTLQAEAGAPVLAAGAGTVAFAGQQATYGNLVVINHNQGIQTRYAQLGSISVQVGQQVNTGTPIGTVSTTSPAPLWFEVRSNSNLGWVAQDPGAYIPEIRAVDPVRRREASED